MEINKNHVQYSKDYQKSNLQSVTNNKTLEKSTTEDTSKNVQADHFPTKEKVKTQIDSMNKVLELNMTSLKFNLHEETDRYYVQVKNQETQEVIREIPTKEFLDLMARITEFTGILMDQKV